MLKGAWSQSVVSSGAMSSHTDAIWAVVVARVGGEPKSRLRDVLDAPQRRALALAMLADVLEACRLAGLAGTLAVVDTPAAHAVVAAAGAQAVADPGVGGMNAAVAAGLVTAIGFGATTAIVLPGDIPLLTPGDLHALLAAAGRASRAVIVAASRDGQGTNALLLRPPDAIVPTFGPPSVERHLAAGRAARAHTLRQTGDGTVLDVDTPADLDLLRLANPGRHTAAALANGRSAPQDQPLVGP
jgi:2-phospho-L-lactate guanylyltransferase